MRVDLERLRRDTPGADNVVHLNNAGASLPPAQVLDAVIGHLRLEAAIGGYEAAARAAAAVERPYDALAAMLGCGRDEIALVESATRGWDMAFYGFAFRPGDRILTAASEYASNYIAFLQIARRTGARIEVVPSDDAGVIDLDALARMIDGRVRLIALTHVPTNGGLVQPAAAVGRIARAAGIPFLLDACQSAGQMPLDVDALGCDVLTATGRKFLRGPRGTGFLYVRRAVLDTIEPPFLDLMAATWTAPDHYAMRPDARRFEAWERSVAGHIGLGVAVDYALAIGLEAIGARVTALAGRLRTGLGALPGVTVRDAGRERCAIVTFTVADRPAGEVRAHLGAEGINVSVSDPSSTLLDARSRGLPALVRASPHAYNTEAEIDRLVEAVDRVRRTP